MKKTQAGYIPNDWDVHKGTDISELITKGESPRWQGFGYQDSGPLFVTSENVRDGFLDISKPKRIPEDFHSKLHRSKLRKNDILINLVGASVGRSCVYNIIEPANINQAVCLLRLSNPDDVPWVSCFLQNPETIRRLLDLVGDGARANISLKDIRDFDYIFPPKSERQRIAEILGACDEAIEAQERLIAQKVQRKKGLMQQLLTGKTRFPQFVRSREQCSSRFFGYPADWSFLKVGQIADQILRRNSFGELPVLSCTKHRGLVDSLSYFKKQVFAEDTSGYKVVARGEFAFATNHLEEGSIGYQDLYDLAIISPIYCVFRTRKNVEDAWLYPLLKTELFRHIFEANTNASVNRRGSIRWSEFKNINVALPSLNEQRAIADFLETVNQELALLRSKLEQLKQQKKGLMQQLLTGKVRVAV